MTHPTARGARFLAHLVARLVARPAVLLLALLLAVSGLATAASTVTAAASTGLAAQAAKAKAPAKDFPHMPRSCVDPKDLIPQEPGICKLTPFKKTRPTIVLWGDSHAWQMIPAIESAIAGKKINLVAFVMGACPPMDPQLNTKAKRDNANSCATSNNQALRFVTRMARGDAKLKVILGGAWDTYLSALRTGTSPEGDFVVKVAREFAKGTPRLFKTLGSAHIRTDLVGQSVVVPPKASCKQGRHPFVCSLPRAQALKHEASNRTWLKKNMRPLTVGPRFIETTNSVCKAKTCRGKIDGIYTFFDDLHLSATRSRTLTRFFAPSVRDIAPVEAPDPEEPPCTIPILGLPC